jgi:four helix bundle protein
MEKKIYFNHEKLEVYQFSLKFIEWLNPLWKRIWKNKNIADQLDRASISIPLNTAEGNGKTYPKDRKRYFEIARASALESASCLDVIVIKKL